MTYQRRLHVERTKRRESQIVEIQSKRNKVSVGFGNRVAGIMVCDNNLRESMVNLDIQSINKIIEELQAARFYLEFVNTVNKMKNG
jgi:hypothetical protein